MATILEIGCLKSMLDNRQSIRTKVPASLANNLCPASKRKTLGNLIHPSLRPMSLLSPTNLKSKRNSTHKVTKCLHPNLSSQLISKPPQQLHSTLINRMPCRFSSLFISNLLLKPRNKDILNKKVPTTETSRLICL